ncbi:glycosyltransferase family 4 protein [Methanoculleus sp. Wushi-C6]|uniref:Glycosyltransferase family 4 protein n=1 Tax=Methanoculleus caldifontis TaxID=2651577 RepID=A0ABU3WYM1_9EURY|nr:glycosyltransferase family 4 protein [Methanoculleus sp. Wushi-C6]MDV2480881.1 glycosyltransferase family 4 protein [Methanoculleus sp. Wushi-C6]
MKQVCIVSQHFPPEKSGNASRIYDTAVHLARLGIDVTVLAPHPTFPTGSFPRTWKRSETRWVDGVRVVRLWTWQPGSGDPGFPSRMAYYLLFPLHAALWLLANRSRFDVIVTSTPPLFTGIPGYVLKRTSNVRWILDIRDLWIDASISLGFLREGSLYERMSRRFEQMCLSRTDLVGVTTEELGRRIRSRYEVTAPMELMPNGVNTEFFRPASQQKKRQIVYAGNVGHAQDLDKVALAVKSMNGTYNLKFLIVGDGDTRESLERLVKAENLTDSVIFAGTLPREEIPRLLSESLLGVAPLKLLENLEYAAPTKAYEYMACGIPFVGCGNGEIAHLAEDSGAGVIAGNTPEAIAATLSSLLDDPERMEEMGRRGREYVAKHYDRKSVAMKLKQQIERMTWTGA